MPPTHPDLFPACSTLVVDKSGPSHRRCRMRRPTEE